MSAIDWLVLAGTLGAIAAYGAWKTRGARDLEGYLRGGARDSWATVALAVMATQASAITFLSTPGQAFEDGLRFVQFYLGVPLAMVVVAAFFVPVYLRLRVFTAYQFLETRFDRKTRQLAAFLFLLQRGLSAGITIYAPSIILSTLLGWPLQLTNLAVGGMVVLYTVSGGSAAVAQTQRHQMAVMLGGLAIAFVYVVSSLPVSFGDAAHLAGALGRMNPITFSVDLSDRYNLLSGLTGGFFLAMAYFGTDQSQVGRYLTARSLRQSRMGLLANGLFKVPMQFLILLCGVMVFVFHLFVPAPVFFNRPDLERARAARPAEVARVEADWRRAFEARRSGARALVAARASGDGRAVEASRVRLRAAQAETEAARRQAKATIKAAVPGAEIKDSDYIFLSFVLGHLPRGLVGLLLAVILCAAMSSSSSELNALGSTTLIDFYKRSFRPDAPEAHQVRMARLFTALWGMLAVLFATFAALIDNLIQAVNIMGSIFYGPILGIFVVALCTKRVRATPVFVAALGAQALVITAYAKSDIGFLWYNVIGCAALVVLALALDAVTGARRPSAG